MDQAKLLYADVKQHGASVSVMVSGTGYKRTFTRWLERAPGLEDVRVHLLTLADVLTRSDAFGRAVADLPLLEALVSVDWKAFRA